MCNLTPNLIKSLINSAEKAANIARICRANESLLSLLVQEKSTEEANPRFVHDFKTLADVLIQETTRHDIGKLFPEILKNINGEESNSFTNRLGESVSVKVGDNEDETAKCLQIVLNGDTTAAEVLALEVHKTIDYNSNLGIVPDLPDDFNYSEIGIWIDPIDATAEYISGDTMFTNFPGITSTGLDCVTVLIGAYNRVTGAPIIGVVSQPFHNKLADNVYESLLFWGVCLGEGQLKATNCLSERHNRSSRLGIFSSSENSDLLQKILNLGYEFAFSAGAGHKALKVITYEVDLYLLSKSSTFKWDTCAPQAILRSLGGNIFDFRESIKSKEPVAVSYSEITSSGESFESEKSNKGGLIAVRDLSLLPSLLEAFTTDEDEVE